MKKFYEIKNMVRSTGFVLILTIIFANTVCGESALGPPIGSNVVVLPETAAPNEEVTVTIQWWIDD